MRNYILEKKQQTNNKMELNNLYNYIEKISLSKYYPYLLIIGAVFLNIFFYLPCFACFHYDSPAWQTVLLKSEDLTNNLNHIGGNSWLAKKVFRLTVPTIIKVFQLNPLTTTILQYLINALLLYFLYKLSLKILKDRVAATFLLLSINFLYFGYAGFYDLTYTWFDIFGYFFLIVAIYSNSPWIIFITSFMAAWNDERAFVALSIVFVYHYFTSVKNNKLLFVNKKYISVVIAGLSYVVLRLYLTYAYNMKTPTADANFSVIAKTIHLFQIGLWSYFEGLWIVCGLFFLCACANKDYFILLTNLLITLVFIIVSFCVLDITRSGSYLVPIIFLQMFYLVKYIKIIELRKILLFVSVINFIYPVSIIVSGWGSGGIFQYSVFSFLLRSILG